MTTLRQMMQGDTEAQAIVRAAMDQEDVVAYLNDPRRVESARAIVRRAFDQLYDGGCGDLGDRDNASYVYAQAGDELRTMLSWCPSIAKASGNHWIDWDEVAKGLWNHETEDWGR